MSICLVTGGAGFIGSHIATALAQRGDQVRVLDDLSTGQQSNLPLGVEFIHGSILDPEALHQAMEGVEVCFHQAALPSVPRSIHDPHTTNKVNVEGTVNVFLAARDAGARRVVYASSSSVYGNASMHPVTEDLPLNPLSPYAASKAAAELYAATFATLSPVEHVGLRYFNVFGPGQSPDGPYAAVIPRFLQAMRAGEVPVIFGDGRQARDFTSVHNVVQANLLAATAPAPLSGVFNIASGRAITLLELVAALNRGLGLNIRPHHAEPRTGDITLSWADISRAQEAFGYRPGVSFEEGIAELCTQR